METRRRRPTTILVLLADEIAIAAFVLWGLPTLGIELPRWALVGIMAGLVARGIVTCRLGSRALRKKPTSGFEDMVGSKGKVVEPLTPQGLIKVGNEIWQAESIDHSTETSGHMRGEVIVVGRKGLTLFVRWA